jgi:hypothetical protein
MKRKEIIVWVLVAFLAGLAGGTLSSKLFSVQPVLATTSPGVSNVVAAKTFQLMDEDGNVRALLGHRSMEGVGLWLYDRSGKALAALEVVEGGTGSLTIGNTQGKIIWSKP